MRISLLLLGIAALSAEAAHAGCCTVRKLDETFPSVTVRVCEPNAAGECGSVLFAGPLSVGDAQNVCSAQDTVLYREAAPGEPFGPFVEAVCSGADVEI
ncbi:MAG TPA: hypothetical protein VFT98_11430 [Myxococcota bacterium]|nr:hypothetical protein [Myxococcota bacterium]